MAEITNMRLQHPVARAITILTFLLALAGCDGQGDGGSPSVASVPSQIVTRVAQARFVEELFDVDTLVLRAPPEWPLGLIECVHLRRDGGLVITQALGAARGVYVFAEDGGFIRKIGSVGSGPGEYLEPVVAVTDSCGRYLVYDARLRRVSLFDSAGNLVSDFEPDIPGQGGSVGLALGGRGWIVLNVQDVYPLDAANVLVYASDGRRLRAFGGLSEEARTVIGRTGLAFNTGGPNLVCLGGWFFASDFASYRIRKYDARGRLVETFGVAPRGWRSMAEADFSKYPRAEKLTPSVMRQLERFKEEEFDRCSFVLGIQPLGRHFLIQAVAYGKRSDVVPKNVFLIYDLNGELVNGHLVFRAPHWRMGAPVLPGWPSGLCVVDYLPGEGAARLICYRVPSWLEAAHESASDRPVPRN